MAYDTACNFKIQVSTHSRPKAAGWYSNTSVTVICGFNTQPPEGGCPRIDRAALQCSVSTHSRPKAAGKYSRETLEMLSFNTQPPEGGWKVKNVLKKWMNGFNTQPPEGGWSSTVSCITFDCSFNTQPPEGGCPTKG